LALKTLQALNLCSCLFEFSESLYDNYRILGRGQFGNLSANRAMAANEIAALALPRLLEVEQSTRRHFLVSSPNPLMHLHGGIIIPQVGDASCK
jgi:hypothetical protein